MDNKMILGIIILVVLLSLGAVVVLGELSKRKLLSRRKY